MRPVVMEGGRNGEGKKVCELFNAFAECLRIRRYLVRITKAA